MRKAGTISSLWPLLILLSAGNFLFGQASPDRQSADRQLAKALVFEEHQRFDEAIVAAQSAIDSHQLSEVSLGRAYIELGFALRMKGRFVDAQHEFDHAIHVLENDRQDPSDYAAALDNYAGLLAETEQFEAAMPFWLKALRVRQSIGDHEELAHSFVNLAGVALGQNQVAKAKQYLRHASDEMKRAGDLTDDDLAVFYETEAWLAMAEGHPSIALDGYQRALDLCQHAHGEQHWLVGWERLLRGRASFQAGDKNIGLADMSAGLATIGQALGQQNPKYVAAEIAYSYALDQAGSHAEAARLRAAADQSQRDRSRSQCVGCTIDVSAFQ